MPSYRGISPEVNGGADLGSASQKWNAVYANHILTTGSLYRRRTRKAFTLADLAAAIADGDYSAKDIAPGDYYIGASGYTYIFASDNPFKGTYADYTITANHAGLIVDTHEQINWNATNDTTGGYVASVLHTYLVNTVLPIVETDLGGVSHLYAHKKLLTNAITDTRYNRFGESTGASSNWAWSDQYISALTEMQIFGGTVWGSSGDETGEACKCLDAFNRFKHTEIFGDESVWLRDIASSARACIAYRNGSANYDNAGNEAYVAGLVCFH